MRNFCNLLPGGDSICRGKKGFPREINGPQIHKWVRKGFRCWWSMKQRLQSRARLGALPKHHLLHHCWRLNVGCRDLWSGPAGDLFCYVQSWHRCQEMTAVPQLILQSSFNPITEVAVLSAAGSPWNNREAGCGISGALAAGGRSPERGKGHLGLSAVGASSAAPALGCVSSAY